MKILIFPSQVCGDTIVGIDAGPKVSAWLNKVLDKSDLKLIRKDPTHHRKPRKFSSEKAYPFLLIGQILRFGLEPYSIPTFFHPTEISCSIKPKSQ